MIPKLKVLGSKVAMPRPPWYERCIKQLPQYLPHLKARTSPLSRCSVKITPTLEKVVSADWGASWTVDFSGAITIIFETKFYNACMSKGMEWELVHTMQHEFMEAKLTIAAARLKYPNISPYIMAEDDVALGGQAHYDTITKLDNISAAQYDDWLDSIFKYLRS